MSSHTVTPVPEMPAEQVEALRLWAVEQMKWERAIAAEKGVYPRVPTVRGIRSLNRNVQAILTLREKSSPKIRGRAAATAIEEAVCRTYKIKDTDR